jgi:lipid-A-disaccharide synthase
MTKKIVIGMVAGEASGDLLGSHLIEALKAARPDLKFIGIGGPRMKSAGMEILYPMEKLAVNGYVEALRHYFEIAGIRRKLRAYMLENPPDAFIAIDAPDFNLDLELALRQRGITTIHYVSPSIWAWRGERIHKIKRAVSLMLALFPHEPEIYRQAGVPVDYVGHPLADLLPVEPNRAEMREMIQQKLPDARFLVPLASRQTRTIFEHALHENEAHDLNITMLFGHAQDAMIAADVVLVASGTATLEAALLKRPMVITYRLPAFSWWLMKRKGYLPYYGLPNILCGRFVVPELMQDDATPENLAQALLNLVNDSNTVAQLEETFTELHLALRQNTAQKAAAAILPHLPNG